MPFTPGALPGSKSLELRNAYRLVGKASDDFELAAHRFDVIIQPRAERDIWAAAQ